MLLVRCDVRWTVLRVSVSALGLGLSGYLNHPAPMTINDGDGPEREASGTAVVPGHTNHAYSILGLVGSVTIPAMRLKQHGMPGVCSVLGKLRSRNPFPRITLCRQKVSRNLGYSEPQKCMFEQDGNQKKTLKTTKIEEEKSCNFPCRTAHVWDCGRCRGEKRENKKVSCSIAALFAR